MSALTKEQMDALPGLVDEATPGPWGWFGHPNDVKLSATHSGRKFVMDFVRKGFSFAQPRFQPNGRGMVKADELLQFEVGDASVRGEKQARGDGSVYRYDVAGIDAPDARLIALAPSLAATVIEQQAEIERLRWWLSEIDMRGKQYGPEDLADLALEGLAGKPAQGVQP